MDFIVPLSRYFGGGGMLHVDMFAHNKSGIAYRVRTGGQRPLLTTKRNPTSSRRCYQVVTTEHQVVPGVPIEQQQTLQNVWAVVHHTCCTMSLAAFNFF
jgi:hypothetical protein